MEIDIFEWRFSYEFAILLLVNSQVFHEILWKTDGNFLPDMAW